MLQRQYQFWVYTLSSKSRTLYIGMTNALGQRLLEHQSRVAPSSFTARYNITRLVHFEEFAYVNNAIRREKELKDWNRAKKIALIEVNNPMWEDLSEVWWRRDPLAALHDG